MVVVFSPAPSSSCWDPLGSCVDPRADQDRKGYGLHLGSLLPLREVTAQAHYCILPFQTPGEDKPAFSLGKGSHTAAGGSGATEGEKQRT